MVTVLILLLLLVAFGAWEYFGHLSRLRRIPIRIHVNGTRGKSSVTRLIAGGLRGSGIPTCAKTTGSQPRMILENGKEYTIQRQGRANIIEQVRAVGVAARRRARAVVLECMALQPQLQDLCERRLVRSTVGVITNARADHLDVMGPTVGDVARALAGTVPARGPLVTAEDDPALLEIFRGAAEKKGAELIPVSPATEGIDNDIMRRFTYLEHPENVALALRACLLAGAERRAALEGMWSAKPDLGALRILRLAFFAKQIFFINAFAANDPESTTRVWQRVVDLHPEVECRVAVLNCRADRPQRSVQLGQILHQLPGLARALVCGSGTRLALEAALRAGCEAEKLVAMEQAPAAAIFERALAQIEKSGLVFGMGNIGGGGTALVEYFKNRSEQSGTNEEN